MPRKFNVCYVASKEMYEHPHINDIAFVPAIDASGQKGWNVEVGGILSATRCEFAIPMGEHGAFVPLDKSWEVAEAIMTTYRDFGKHSKTKHQNTKLNTLVTRPSLPSTATRARLYLVCVSSVCF